MRKDKVSCLIRNKERTCFSIWASRLERFLVLTACCSVIFIACSKSKEPVEQPGFSEATYKITFTMNWTMPAFTVPPGAHITIFAGMVHDTSSSMWSEGKYASPGLENLAEEGGFVKIGMEQDSIIHIKRALSKFIILPPVINGTTETYLSFNSHYPCFSFATMIAPSPDWFTGISGFSLYQNQHWVEDVSLDLYAWDAGTEEGDIFGYNNPPTVPQQFIKRLTSVNATVLANGNSQLAPIGTIHFKKD